MEDDINLRYVVASIDKRLANLESEMVRREAFEDKLVPIRTTLEAQNKRLEQIEGDKTWIGRLVAGAVIGAVMTALYGISQSGGF